MTGGIFMIHNKQYKNILKCISSVIAFIIKKFTHLLHSATLYSYVLIIELTFLFQKIKYGLPLNKVLNQCTNFNVQFL